MWHNREKTTCANGVTRSKSEAAFTADAIAADVVDCDAILARPAPFPAKVV